MSFENDKPLLDARPLPDEFFRAIDTQDFYDIDFNAVKKAAFQFKYFPDGLRPDMEECSINWNDDENACLCLKERKYGYSKIKISDFSKEESYPVVLDSLRKLGLFDYGRDCIEDNIYHGNLYLKKDLEKSKREMIQTILSFIASKDFTKTQVPLNNSQEVEDKNEEIIKNNSTIIER